MSGTNKELREALPGVPEVIQQELASSGEKLFQDLACVTCHRADTPGRGPVLQRS